MRRYDSDGYLSEEMKTDLILLNKQAVVYSDAIGFVVDEIMRVEHGIREHGSEQDVEGDG
jgi:hypothetical protein